MGKMFGGGLAAAAATAVSVVSADGEGGGVTPRSMEVDSADLITEQSAPQGGARQQASAPTELTPAAPPYPPWGLPHP